MEKIKLRIENICNGIMDFGNEHLTLKNSLMIIGALALGVLCYFIFERIFLKVEDDPKEKGSNPP